MSNVGRQKSDGYDSHRYVDDREAIWRVHTRAIREIAASAYAPTQIESWAGFLTPESYTEVIEAGRVFVAEESGQIAGFGQFNAKTGEVEATYVLPDVKDRGVGRLLLASESRARATGLGSIHLSASLNAVGFYEAAGFMRERRAYHQLPSGVAWSCASALIALTPNPVLRGAPLSFTLEEDNQHGRRKKVC